MGRRVVSVSQNAVAQAESEIRCCDQCGSSATTPFWQILDELRTRDENEIVYILPVLANCPSSSGPIDEITLVEPKCGSGVTPLDPVLSQSQA